MRVPLEDLDQATQEELLHAVVDNDEERLESLINRHNAAPADREQLAAILSGLRPYIYPETTEKIRAVLHSRALRDATILELEQNELSKAADTAGHGYSKNRRTA